MKLHATSPSLVLCGALFGLLAGPLSAQTARPAGAALEEEIKLTPFTLNESKENGFVAASSLAGGRIATALKDTPVAYSVITAEFLDAFHLTNTTQAAEWSVNSTYIEADGSNRVFGVSPSAAIRTRGVSAGVPSRNFFPFAFTADSYILDRIDFARGPNAVLFGAGGIGGTINSVTKQATTDRTINEVRIEAGSYNHYRGSLDFNRPLTKNLALRLNAVGDRSDTWRENEWTKRTGVHLAAIYKLTPRLTLRADGEYGKYSENKSISAWQDGLSGWDGVTTFSSIPVTALTGAEAANIGVTRITTNKWVQSGYFGPNLINFQNTYQTKALSQNNDLTLTSKINGQPIRTVGWFLGNQAMIDIDYGISTADRYGRALSGARFSVPTRESNPTWAGPKPTFQETGKDASLVLDFNPTDKLFFQVAANANRSHIVGDTSLRRGLPDMRIDIQKNLPNGAPNPNVLRPYSEFYEYLTIRDANYKNLRVQGVYVENTRFGKLQFSLMGGVNNLKAPGVTPTLLLPITTFTPDARGWLADQNSYGYYKRIYVGDSRYYAGPSTAPVTVFSPLTGVSQTVTPRWMENNQTLATRNTKYYQTAANLDLFKNRLVLIGAFRRDFAFVEQLNSKLIGNMPVGWDGLYTSADYRPKAPADFTRLTYVPKDAAGNPTGPAQPADARPRSTVNGISLAQAQYAGDRFRDDYSSPPISPVINTFTLGGVVNVTKWLGLYGNVSDTFDLQLPQLKLDGTLLQPTTSRGTDYGIRITLPNGRLAMSIGQYRSHQKGAAINNFFQNTYNFIYQAPAVGDLSSTGRNIRNVADLPGTLFDTQTVDASGYEFEVTANPTRGWRLILNAGKSNPYSKDQNPLSKAFLAADDTRARQILADAGVLIDSANVASINPALNDPTRINVNKVTSAVTAWNNLQQVRIPDINNQIPLKSQGSSEWVGNIATDYRFQTGRLRGIRVGAGVNYRGGQVVSGDTGTRSSDTIRDPNDPNRAIDDPTVNAQNPVIAPSYYKAIASLSYTFKLKERRTLELALNVDNVLNRRDPVYGAISGTTGTGQSILKPRSDLFHPEHIVIPGNITYLTPRNYTVSAKLSF